MATTRSWAGSTRARSAPDFQQEIHLQTPSATSPRRSCNSYRRLNGSQWWVLDCAFRSALANAQPTVVIIPHDVQQAPAAELGQIHGELLTALRWTTGHILPRGASEPGSPRACWASHTSMTHIRSPSEQWDISDVIEALVDPDVPLLPPFPHGEQKLDQMRTGLKAECTAGERALKLLETHVQVERDHGEK